MGESRTSSNRVSVYGAAEIMGVTVDAIRKRISRGTIPHERDNEGRVWVLLDTDQDAASKVQDTDQSPSATDTLISEMRDRITSLEHQLDEERKANSEHRRLLAAALERIPPQLEPPKSSKTVEDPSQGVEPHPGTEEAQEAVQRPWWRRWLGG